MSERANDQSSRAMGLLALHLLGSACVFADERRVGMSDRLSPRVPRAPSLAIPVSVTLLGREMDRQSAIGSSHAFATMSLMATAMAPLLFVMKPSTQLKRVEFTIAA